MILIVYIDENNYIYIVILFYFNNKNPNDYRIYLKFEIIILNIRV